ncbi:hypothetical protein [Breznakia pachnodae]|uniref:Uncharacterized protein n=1 Tax=Breznakia pachnodae TaxID=265178 RepID=A0ABU0E8N3_9FIRM|nr:hypothetical protein [Breznakia pachnodae]MDQ0363258.1 hypothetical protein [Breznakia pachnodae]
MNYFVSENILYKTELEVKVKDYVVVMSGYHDTPSIARVENMVNEYDALTKYDSADEVIDVVDMKTFNEKREKEVRRRILLDKMDDEMRTIKALETLEKYAGKSEAMTELHAKFKNLDNPVQSDNSQQSNNPQQGSENLV